MSNRNVLIVGNANSGKSTSLRNLRERQAFAYFNSDGKDLPIRGANAFLCNQLITNPTDVLAFYAQLEKSDKCQGVILDTLTFLFNMFERKVVNVSSNTMQGWSDYGKFYEELTEIIKTSNKPQIVMAHTNTELNEQTMQMESRILLKGAVGKRGVDADYTNVITAKQMPVKKLEGYESPLLTITPEEEAMGVKYVFCTKLNKESIGDRTRSAMGMWDLNETYIDNDVQIVLDRLNEFYTGEQ